MKPDCYECKHRGGIAGDAHSRCLHPKIREVTDDPLIQIMGILGSVGRVPPIFSKNPLGVTGNKHGINSGWFNWPVNFDPVWLESCDGFEAVSPAISQAVSPENASTRPAQ